MWITNGPYAETLVVYAKTDPPPGPRGITAFLIEKGIQGIPTGAEARQARHARLRHLRAGVRGLRGAGGERARRGRRRRERPDVGPRLRARRARRPGRSASCRPASTSCMPYVHERKQFGQPIGEFQLVQGKLADMYVALNASRAYVYAVARPATAAGPRARTPPVRSSTRPRTPPRWRSTRSSCWAATATSTTIRPGASCATPSSTRSAPAPSEIRRMLIGRELFNKG